MNDDTSSNQTMQLSINFKWISLALVLVILGMLYFWKPWQTDPSSSRSITETGESTIEATPDEYHFNPYFEAKHAEQSVATEEATTKANKVVEGLKEQGVAEDDITLSSYGGDRYYYITRPDGEETQDYQVTVNMQIVVDSRELAQKVQDYLLTTDAKGSLSPSARFSETKQDELETQAREEAIADAKAKAEASVELLDAELGKVLEVGDISGGGIEPYFLRDTTDAVSSDIAEGAPSSLPVLPGKDDFSFSINVKFEIK